MAEKYVSDNSGHRVTPHTGIGTVVAASGQGVTSGFSSPQRTFTVVSGAVYRVSSSDAGGGGNGGSTILLSITGVTSTAANIEWVCPLGKILYIRIPVGKTTLYLSGVTNGRLLYIARVY